MWCNWKCDRGRCIWELDFFTISITVINKHNRPRPGSWLKDLELKLRITGASSSSSSVFWAQPACRSRSNPRCDNLPSNYTNLRRRIRRGPYCSCSPRKRTSPVDPLVGPFCRDPPGMCWGGRGEANALKYAVPNRLLLSLGISDFWVSFFSDFFKSAKFLHQRNWHYDIVLTTTSWKIGTNYDIVLLLFSKIYRFLEFAIWNRNGSEKPWHISLTHFARVISRSSWVTPRPCAHTKKYFYELRKTKKQFTEHDCNWFIDIWRDRDWEHWILFLNWSFPIDDSLDWDNFSRIGN